MTAHDYAGALDDLRVDEGLRLTPYRDTRGVLTIGYGINLDQGITRVEAEMLLEGRVADRIGALTVTLPWFPTLAPARQRVLINMAYQLGVGGLLGFRHMLEALRRGDYELAADEMLDSDWARQTPARAQRLAQEMRAGHVAP